MVQPQVAQSNALMLLSHHQLELSSVDQSKRRRKYYSCSIHFLHVVPRKQLLVQVSDYRKILISLFGLAFKWKWLAAYNSWNLAVPEADKTVSSGAPAGGLTSNGNLVTPGCGKILDKKNKAIKKSKIKIDPVSTFTSCEGNVCSVSCKPGRKFDKMSKGAVNGVIKVILGLSIVF